MGHVLGVLMFGEEQSTGGIKLMRAAHPPKAAGPMPPDMTHRRRSIGGDQGMAAGGEKHWIHARMGKFMELRRELLWIYLLSIEL
jgi:hypothetical protein